MEGMILPLNRVSKIEITTPSLMMHFKGNCSHEKDCGRRSQYQESHFNSMKKRLQYKKVEGML